MESKISANEQPVEKKAAAFHIGKEVRSAEEVVINYNFSTKLPWLIPPGIREEKGSTPTKPDDLSYLISQVNLGLQMGGGIKEDAKHLQQRPGIVDLGVAITPTGGLQICNGGEILHRQLQKDGWKISDIYFQQLLTEQKRVASGEKRETFRVTIRYRKEEKELPREMLGSNLQRLQKITWGFVQCWDNTKTPNKNITINFGVVLEGKLHREPENIVIL